MIKYEDDGTKKACCDRCSKELTDTIITFISGDAICKECFENEHKEISVEEYLSE